MKRPGFTVVEILLVVTFIAVSSTLIGVAVYRNLDRVSLSGGARRVLHVARYARLLAAEHHRPCTLHIDLDQNSYWLTAHQNHVPIADTVESAIPAGDIVNNVYARPNALPDPLSFSLVRTVNHQHTAGHAQISFNADGTADAALVHIASKDETLTILIYPWTGKAILKDHTIIDLPTDTINLDKTPISPTPLFR